MSMVTRFGKPDLFLTMTSNPDWLEIRENLYQHQTASDRPDLVTRVFNMKLKELIHDVVVEKIFGAVCFAFKWFQNLGCCFGVGR